MDAMPELEPDTADCAPRPTPAALFAEALNRVRMDWPDLGEYEERMWELSAFFNEGEELTLKRYELWVLALYLLTKLLYGPQGADSEAVLAKPAETVH